jgi:hypothetical protein
MVLCGNGAQETSGPASDVESNGFSDVLEALVGSFPDHCMLHRNSSVGVCSGEWVDTNYVLLGMMRPIDVASWKKGAMQMEVETGMGAAFNVWKLVEENL